VGGKTALILAPLIVGCAALWLAYWLGLKVEQSRKRAASSVIDARLHTDLVELVRRILRPADLDQAAYLPPQVQQLAQRLLAEADANADRVRQRRHGF
jgi:hypothetical protein